MHPTLLSLALALAPVASAEDPVEAPAAGPVSYAIDTSKSQIYVQVFKDDSTAAAGLSHNHIMRATGYTAQVSYAAADPSACAFEFSVPVDKLAVDEDSMRSQVGYEAQITDDQRADVRKNMLASGQLDSGAHPNITFKSTGCSGSGDAVTLNGNLTIKGKAKAISVPMTVKVEGSTFAARGTFQVKHTDFGIDPYTALFGQLKNQNTMKFTVTLRGNAS